MKTTRREFLKVSTALAAGAALTASMPGSTDHVHATPAQTVEPDPLGEWLECDGSSFYVEEAPELYQVIGTQYGAPHDWNIANPYHQMANLPDFRVRLEERYVQPFLSNSPREAMAIDGFTGQPAHRAIRYLIKTRHGTDTGTSDPFGEVPIGTIIASL